MIANSTHTIGACGALECLIQRKTRINTIKCALAHTMPIFFAIECILFPSPTSAAGAVRAWIASPRTVNPSTNYIAPESSNSISCFS